MCTVPNFIKFTWYMMGATLYEGDSQLYFQVVL